MSDPEEPYTMEEIEAELAKIRNRKRPKSSPTERYCTSENLTSCLRHLDQELDYFDSSHLSEPFDTDSLPGARNVLCDLIDSAFGLIEQYRDVVRERESVSEQNTRLSSDVKSLKKTIDALRKDLASKLHQIDVDKQKHCLERIKNDELKTKITLANREINVIQKENRTNENRYRHEVRKAEERNRRLETKFRKDCGSYVSRDANTIAVIDKYKQNEQALKETIEQLRASNHEMLEEVLRLREKVDEGI